MMKDKRGRKRGSKMLIGFGIVLIIISVVFLIYQRNKIDNKKDQGLRLEKQFQEDIEIKNNQIHGKRIVEDNMESKTQNNFSYKDETDESLSSAIGVIRINKIGVVLPILENASEQSLLEGVGLVENTDLPTSKTGIITVLAGHRGGRNEDQTFLNIDKLEIGDEIEITTKEEVLHYKVVGQEIIEPTDWSKFTREEEKTKLFLMSCHPYPQNYQRLLVKAELVRRAEI